MKDTTGKNLYAISIDESAEQRLRDRHGTFEVEFMLDESQIVKFPISVGVNGFAYQTNSVNYLNNC